MMALVTAIEEMGQEIGTESCIVTFCLIYHDAICAPLLLGAGDNTLT